MQQSQRHPQYIPEKATTDGLMAVKGEPSDHDLAELARLLVRFHGFPGAYDIQERLKTLLERWGYTRESLFEKTRELHEQGVYHIETKRDDWA